MPLSLMPTAINIAGQTFGRLTVIRRVYKPSPKALWRCVCECGKTLTAMGILLRRGIVKSCGCLHRERAERMKLRHGHARAGKHTPIYYRWHQMVDRCNRKTHKRYKDYGGRGIKVCRRWKRFENFLADMGEPPRGLILDRRNNNGNYTPGNCRWTSRSISARNTRRQNPI